jgi:hypothetical protein
MPSFTRSFLACVVAIAALVSDIPVGMAAVKFQNSSSQSYAIADPDLYPSCLPLLDYPVLDLSSEFRILPEASGSWPRVRYYAPGGEKVATELRPLHAFHGFTTVDHDDTVPVRAAGAGKVMGTGYYGSYCRCLVMKYRSGLTIMYGRLCEVTAKRGTRLYGGEELGRWATGASWLPKILVAVPRKK